MWSLPILDFARDLSSIPESGFTDEAVLAFLREHRADAASLAPYLHFSPDHYTRNLIHRTPLFELIAICFCHLFDLWWTYCHFYQ